MTVQGNGGIIAVNHKETFPVYKKDVWFSKYAITKIIAIKTFIKQYQVTYDSTNQIFVVHREYQEKPNIKFKIQKYGLHCYNTTDKSVTLINIISGNKQGFSNKKINGAKKAKTLYSKIGYKSVKDFRWIVKSLQIMECLVTVQDIDIAHEILGKIAALKGKTTKKKPIHVTGEIVKICR